MKTTSTRTILSTWRFPESVLDRLRESLPRFHVVQESATGSADVDLSLTRHPDTEVLYTALPATASTAPERLELVQLHSAGTDAIRTQPMWTWPIALASGSGITSTAVAELALAGLLSLRRRLGEIRDLQRTATWPSDRLGLAGRELYRSTALIVGYGSVGRATARLLDGLGVQIVAVHGDPARRAYEGYTSPGTGDPDGTIPARWHHLDELADLLPGADQVVLCAPPGPQPIIGARELGRMKDTALLVNIGRGGLVDTEALAVALTGRTIEGALLDVTDPEPLPDDSSLWRLPNCMITPHLAGTTHEAAWHGASLLIENVRRLAARQPVLNLIAPRAGSRPSEEVAG